MDEETREASRLRYATTDANDRYTRMLTEIRVGGTKEQSLVVSSPEDEDQWDRMAASIAAIPKGATIIYGWNCWED